MKTAKELELSLLLKESHIQQLNLRVDNLSNTIDRLLQRNDDLKQEIKRLKESEEYHRKGFAELHKRIDEAIEYIEVKWKEDSYYDDIDNCLKFVELNEFDKNDLLNILQGSDKDGKN